MKLKKESKTQFTIQGLIDKPRWKSIPCICHESDITKQYPLIECKNCKFQECEDSMPRKTFEVIEPIHDKNGNITTNKKTRIINEIKIHRGKKFQDILGWSF